MFDNKKLKETIKRLTEEKTVMQEELWEIAGQLEEKTVGVLIVDVPIGYDKDKTDSILKVVQERMNEEMKRIGCDMDWIVLPGIVKSAQIITVKTEAKE